MRLHDDIDGSSLARAIYASTGPLHLEVLHLFRCYTHTHTHTCSEQSLRILMWNASYVQKHSIKPDRKSMETRSEKNLEVCISTSLLDANRSLPDIKFGFKIV